MNIGSSHDLLRFFATIKSRFHLAECCFFSIVYDQGKFSNREQSETNRNDENAMCEYFSEYLRMCF